MELKETVYRGDIYYIETDTSTCGLAMVVSNDTTNLYTDSVTVVMLSHDLSNMLPTHCVVETGEFRYKVKCEELHTIDKKALITFSDGISTMDMVKVDKCLYKSLGLPEWPNGEAMKERGELYSRIHDMELNYAAEKTRAYTFEKLYNELLNLCVGK